MKPAVKNLTIEAGTSYERVLRFYTDKARTVPLDLTGSTLHAQIRAGSFAIDVGLTITDAVAGVVALAITPEQTRDVQPGTYKWDMLVTASNGKISKYTKGIVDLLPTQTILAP